MRCAALNVIDSRPLESFLQVNFPNILNKLFTFYFAENFLLVCLSLFSLQTGTKFSRKFGVTKWHL
jgi:hypothetical protein